MNALLGKYSYGSIKNQDVLLRMLHETTLILTQLCCDNGRQQNKTIFNATCRIRVTTLQVFESLINSFNVLSADCILPTCCPKGAVRSPHFTLTNLFSLLALLVRIYLFLLFCIFISIFSFYITYARS